MNKDNKFFITNQDNKGLNYDAYYRRKWEPIMEALKLDHKPHECRHTFATMMNNAGANAVSLQRIMGHASKNITDRVYTHKDIKELIKAIDLI